jgi:hypothetical protein
MAELTYTVTVASGNLYGGGTGSVYYLDGARNSTGPGTVSWVQGATLRFEQSDNSNDNHPLIFSTNTSTSGIISSGITYYLDGSSNQTNYTNTTTFNAATTRYVEVTPSSQTDFYYLCYVHGIGMGGIFDITSTTWGALTWGEGLWSQQGNMGVSVSGISLTSAIGSETFSANADVTVSGISLSSSIGTALGFSLHTQAVTGQSASASVSSVVAGTGDIVGLSSAGQLTSTIGSVTATAIIEIGWGGDTWGENQWGDLSGSEPTITGQQLTSTLGTLQSITANADVSVVGQSLTSTQGTTAGGASVAVLVTGSLESMAVGSTVVGIGAPVVGQSLTSTIGTATVDESTLTGIGWGRGEWGEFAWGDSFSVQLTGQSLTSSIGNETAFTDITVSVSGSQANFTQGSFSLQIDQDIFVLASEDQLDIINGGVSGTIGVATVDVTGQSATLSQGSTVGGVKTPVDVTGIQLTSTLGTTTLEQTTVESVTGQQIAMSLGQHAEIPGQIIGVGGLQLASSIGSVTADGTAATDVTGIQMTISVGSPNITAWAEVNPGVNNVWAEVDLAA